MDRENISKKVKSKSSQGVLKNAGSFSLATLCSRILGLVREQAFAFFFGAGVATDAFNIAFRIPNLLRDLFAEGAMSSALVPTFIRTRKEEGEKRSWRVAGLVFRVLFVSVTLLSIIGIVFAPQLVDLYASAFREIPGKFELTVDLTRILFPFFPLVVLAAAFMAILNSCGVYFLPAFASALFNLTSVVCGVTLTVLFPFWGWQPIYGMAIGFVAGAMVQAFCQLPKIYQQGYRWQPRQQTELATPYPKWHEDPALRRVLMLMIPGTIGLAATQFNILVNSILATSEGTGAVSWLNYAFRLLQFPIGVFGVALSVATLPRVSEYWVARKYSEFSSTLSESVKQVFAVNLPAAVGLAVLSGPIIELIFQYGEFTAYDTRQTSYALMAYSIGLVFYSMVKIYVPVCYAMGRTKIAVISSVVSVGVNLGLALWWVKEWSYVGLALATSVTALVNSFFLSQAIRSTLSKVDTSFSYAELIRSFAVHCVISGVMGATCYFFSQSLVIWLPDDLLVEWIGNASYALIRLIRVALLVIQGIGVVALMGVILKNSELLDAMRLFVSKIQKVLKK